MSLVDLIVMESVCLVFCLHALLLALVLQDLFLELVEDYCFSVLLVKGQVACLLLLHFVKNFDTVVVGDVLGLFCLQVVDRTAFGSIDFEEVLASF